jgi:phage gpG-like protein
VALRVQGDFGRLEDLLASFAKLASPALRAELIRDMAEEALQAIQQEFDTGRDPYGKTWRPPKSGTNLPMIRSGRLMSGWSYRPTPDGFELEAEPPYASFLQDGTRKMEARKMVPDGDDLPPLWRLRFEKAVEKKLFEIAFR